jgi:hypothetical protein
MRLKRGIGRMLKFHANARVSCVCVYVVQTIDAHLIHDTFEKDATCDKLLTTSDTSNTRGHRT